MHVLFVGSIFASVASSQRLLCITRSIILYKESKDFRRICFSIRKLCISTFFESYYITRKEHFPYDWCSVVNSNCSCSILSSVFSIILSVLWCYQCHVALQISIFFFFFSLGDAISAAFIHATTCLSIQSYVYYGLYVLLIFWRMMELPNDERIYYAT